MIIPTTTTMLMVTLCFIGYIIANGEAMASTSLADRGLQTNQTLNYRATYKADFQHLSDLGCSADPPAVQITCYGAAMTILNVSDPSINCTKLEDPIVRDGTTFICGNTCVDCTNVYAASRDIIEGPFASILFTCEGDDIENIDAVYTFTDGNPGSCVSTSTTSSRNYHVGRLGVSCPLGASREFVYDDTYVECFFGDSTSPGFVLDITPELDDIDTYTCLSGDNCQGAACTVPFDLLVFNTQSKGFAETCVETLVAANVVPTPAPQIYTGSTRYKTQYEASWGQIFSSTASISACTTTANPTILIKCEAGSSIFYVNSTDPLMQCVPLSSNELSCSGDIASIRASFTTVTYTCIGPTASVSEVTFPDSSASCSGNLEEVIFSNFVSLGLLCEASTSEIFYYYGDLALECADAANNFDYGDAIGNVGDLLRYVCSESATFAVGSTSPQIIRNVTIGVEKSWLRNADVCFELVPAPVPIAPRVPVTNPPSVSPITITATTSPIKTLTVSPTPIPSMGTVTATESPRMQSVVSTTIAPMSINSAVGTTTPRVSLGSTTEDSDKSIVGIAIGSAVGGFALAVVIGLIVFFKNRNQFGSTNKPCNESQNTESNTYDDFASPRSPALPHEYITNNARAAVEQPSSNNREVVRHGASSSPSHPSLYPTNHLGGVNDQRRNVAMMQSSSPTFMSQADYYNNTTMPSSQTRNKEPDGSFLMAI